MSERKAFGQANSGANDKLAKLPAGLSFLHFVRASCVLAAFHGGRGMRKCLRLSLKLVFIAYLLFSFIFLLLRYLVLPQVENYQPDIEQFVSAKIGRQVKILKVSASWQGINPRLELQNLVVYDQHAKAVLTLPQVNTSLSWWSLALLDLRFDEIEFLRPNLEVRRLTDGSIEIAGFTLSQTSNQNDDRALDWLLAQHAIFVRSGTLKWDDLHLKNPVLSIEKFDFLLANQWRKHQFSLTAQPPTHLASPVDIRGEFQQSVFARKKSKVDSWSGELYVDLKKADLPAIHQYFPFPFQLQKGLGSVRTWLKMDKGRLIDITADVQLQDVLGKFRQDLPVLDVAQVSGRIIASERILANRRYLSWIPGETGHSLALVNFSMQTRDGLVLPATTLKETFTPGENGQGEKVEFFAESLDLHSLANFAEHLPLPSDQRRLLIDVAPKGVLKNFTARWQGSFPEISSYSIKGQFSNLEMQAQKAQLARPKTSKTPAKAAVPAIPGFDNLSGSIDASDKGGSITLDSSDLILQLPTYFVDPLMPFKSFKMQARWQFQQDDRLEFQIRQLDFVQDGAHAQLRGHHRLSMRHADLGEVDLEGRLDGFDLKTITRYIPSHTPEHLKHWLSNALLDGEANDVEFRLNGPLANFPFNQKELEQNRRAEFYVRGDLRNAKLNFLPGVFAKDGVNPFWPVIDNIKGSFSFDRAKMEIRADTATTNGVALSKVKATIPDLLEHDVLLQIDGLANGALQTMLNYVKASPVDDWLSNFLHDTIASGNSQLNLKLQLPLNSIVDSKVNGVLSLNNNETVLQPDLPAISGLVGKIEFNEKGVNLNTLRANLLGGPVTASGGSQKDGSIRVRLDGNANADGIRKHFANLEFVSILDSLNGDAKYTAQINSKRKQTEVIVESDMQGFEWKLPAPLNKAIGEITPLRFEIVPDFSSDTSEQKEQIKLSVGNRLNAHYLRRKELDKSAKWSVTRAAVALNAPAILPDYGLNLHVQAHTLNVDEWRHLLESVGVNKQSGPNSKNLKMENRSQTEFSQYLAPTSFSVITNELNLFGKKINEVTLGASHFGGVWQANLDSKQASGFISWNGFDRPDSSGQITARLSRLMIPKSAANDVGELLEAKNTTRQIPSLDIRVENFELFNKKLGLLNLNASNTVASRGREWNIDQLNLKNDDAELSATGNWIARSNDSQTNLRFNLDIINSGKLLERLDFPDVVHGGKGKLEGDVQWRGLPFDMDIPSMNGQLQLKLATGQFLKVDSGAAKLLGVLSMQSLPRRFTLDFRDVFSEGFAFDGITGTAQIQNGIAKTDNLKMNSVNAAVLMEGSADIAKETQNLHVAVIPDLNAGAASVVYGLAVNPVIGLGTFLAQLFFRDPLKRAFTYEYQITGPWLNPVVTKIENKERQQILEKQKAEQAKTKAEVK
ncbi:YhdP family protein [Undibacterium fentianense]|uniref:TIGR02099 family protein n=1 Tax=Undibacterium fentianense TaxID=2828728 RepID=A0A941DZY3_9BURK|nr:YhdP family protein [Undibacterium fentianense]MBR7798771.1 TIGR02099 family protein [Undibacterium fentianense]